MPKYNIFTVCSSCRNKKVRVVKLLDFLPGNNRKGREVQNMISEKKYSIITISDFNYTIITAKKNVIPIKLQSVNRCFCYSL